MAQTLIDGVEFAEAATGIATANHMTIAAASGYFAGVRFKNCTTRHATPRATWSGLVSGGQMEGMLIFEGCTTITNHTSGGDPGPVIAASHPGSTSGSVIKLIGHSISGWSFGNYRAINNLSSPANLDVVVDGCTGFALGAYVNVPANNSRLVHSYTFTSPTMGFRHEYAAGVVDWNPNAAPAYPTRSASMFDGTPWSLKMDWFAATANVVVNFLTPKLSTICRLSSAARTVSVDFLSPVTLNSKNIALRVHYVATDGKAYCDTTWAKSGVLTLPVSAWTGAGSFPSHAANRLSLTTSQSVAVDTEIFAFLEIVGPPPGGSGIQLYVDPELGLT